jgi:hypothetical protein
MKLPFVKNRVQLRRLLTIDDPRKETIFGIVGRMEILIDYLSSQKKDQNLILFLKTYYWVTKRAAEKYVLYKHYFWSVREYEILDVHFASLYFKPLLDYLEEGEMKSPWHHYFEYCKKKEGLPLLQTLLGINAHINTDLYQAMIDIDYKNKNDFFLVNTVLKEVVPDVIKMLALEHDLVGVSGLAFRDFVNEEFKTTIIRWREEAWDNVQTYKLKKPPDHYHKISQNTELLAKDLIESFSQIYSFNNLPDNIKRVNNLSVKIGMGV